MKNGKIKIVWDDIIATDDLALERAILKENGMGDVLALRVSNKDPQAFFKAAADADGLCAYLPIRAADFSRLPRCRVIAAPALGVDPFDLEAATSAGVCVCNAPEYCLEEVATHTVALVLDCVRRIARLDRRLRSGVWDWQERGIQHRLSRQTYGLISFGNIPRRVAAMMRGFGVRLIAFDPFAPDEAFTASGVLRAESLEALLAQSDILSVHTPYNEHTRHMLGREQFAHVKEGAVFVVTGRGGVVEETALREAVLEGRIPAAALDVIEDETTFQSVLLGMPEVVITPHCGYYSEESTEELRRTNVLQLIDVLRDNRPPRYLVNRQMADDPRFRK